MKYECDPCTYLLKKKKKKNVGEKDKPGLCVSRRICHRLAVRVADPVRSYLFLLYLRARSSSSSSVVISHHVDLSLRNTSLSLRGNCLQWPRAAAYMGAAVTVVRCTSAGQSLALAVVDKRPAHIAWNAKTCKTSRFSDFSVSFLNCFLQRFWFRVRRL
jgi:hypothetical protein